MMKTISVLPNYKGVLYKNNTFENILDSGKYRKFGFATYNAVSIPVVSQTTLITNQEVLTKDNVALRFSYYIRYVVTDIKKFSGTFDVFKKNSFLGITQEANPFADAEEFLHLTSQTLVRNSIISFAAEELNAKRNELLESVEEKFSKIVEDAGIKIESVEIRDITFPKNIQDIFSYKLESSIRSQVDLENARTQVASVRALKNAADMIRDNPNIKYIQWLETIIKLAAKGNHTFVLNSDIDVPLLKQKSDKDIS
jgi:regulator of protease activity HflC (stomatin/prohibitin superfamily)